MIYKVVLKFMEEYHFDIRANSKDEAEQQAVEMVKHGAYPNDGYYWDAEIEELDDLSEAEFEEDND